jgi:two-component system chemotaxis response regulator CheY
MRTLVVEDDFISRKIMKEILSGYGGCDVVIDGNEAVQTFRMAVEEGRYYDLVCLDVMMPNMDGHEALKHIRALENEWGLTGTRETRVIMTTALDDPHNVFEAYYKGGATSYLTKPISRNKLLKEIQALGLAV